MATKVVAAVDEGPVKLKVEVLPVTVKEFEVRVEGLTPLIVHRFSEKAKKWMRDKQQRGISAKKINKNPTEEIEACKYKDSAGREGMTILAFKAAVVDAARHVDKLKKADIKGTFFVVPDFNDAEDGTPCVYLEGAAVGREDFCRVGNGIADLRYRPEYTKWAVVLRIQYDAGLINQGMLLNLLHRAGFSGGVGDWRPSSPVGKSGDFGRFKIV